MKLLSIVLKRFTYFRKLISENRENVKSCEYEDSIIHDYIDRINVKSKETYFSGIFNFRGSAKLTV